jgi:SAM-dependent methyltransferase
VQAKPDAALTWGVELTGDAFVAKAAQHGAFGPVKDVLEIGPGYGRLLKAALTAKQPFRSYTALDISQQNLDYLRKAFAAPNIRFVHGDAETVALDGAYDTVVSSLVFKHLYPTFGRALTHLAKFVCGGGRFCFDLLEGEVEPYFEHGGVNYLRYYTRPEVERLLTSAGLRLAAFDEVEHDAEHRRLLVVAEKPV